MKHYEKIADAPAAIGCLRGFILDLAVRGKLVSQDPNDEPASTLLKQIATEKARLVKAGDIRKFVEPISIPSEEHPFELPRNWQWARLGDLLTKLTDGTHHSPPNGPTGDFKYVTAKNIKNDGVLLDDITYVSREVHEEIFARCNPEKGDILYIKDGATTGVVTVNDLDEPFSMLSSVALLKLPTCLLNRLVLLFLRSPFFYDQMRGFMKGAAITRVTLKRMGPALFPIPPLAEQRRIVNKVDELMGLCDRLEAAHIGREAVRDRLAAASLVRLNATDPQTFQADAHFTLGALSALTTRPDQIKALRQTILNLAVRGKLVPQAGDEPASKLLKRIAEEIAAYAKAHRLGQSHAKLIVDDDLPFATPNGWEWTRLCALFKAITDGDHQPPPKADKGVAFLTIGNVTTGRLDFTGCRLVPKTYFKTLPPYRTPAKGDILYTVVGATYGRPALVETDRAFCVQRHIAILKPVEAMSLRFLMVLLASPLIYDQATRSTTGTAQPTIALRPLRNFLAPVPPLPEQHRIAAKVDELMALCDRLEASLTASAGTRRRLLDALLAEALTPADAGELEAAE
ncbi:type I restriction enzyme S subunit [Bradyrhizobium japonicum USDA 38]|uniref:restriction endonuclease subunit S n=1 Tax=Bradyrhizobium japonicum TaxID=375 RepID=UPI001FDA951B|nr:restriction endonuclease subunit S [Bradyrhizobium japonicum]MCS3895143.1 type I restriction enzyme S subunit [Bradyrhizobium japonicum USDA 38]MCS3947658.1 type I restriction enzyme S subunit [Bradyrhizobium japonicum]